MSKYTDVEIDFSLLEEKPLDLSAIFIKYYTHRKWFAISILFFGMITFIYSVYTIPSYKVETSILFKDDIRGGTSELNVLKEVGLITQKSNVDNEIEILKKSLIIEKVIREKDLFITYYEYRTFDMLEKIGISNILPKFINSRKTMLYGDNSPIRIKMLNDSVDTITTPIDIEVIVNTRHNLVLSGTYKGSKFEIQSGLNDSIITLPFGEIKLLHNNIKSDGKEKVISINIKNSTIVALAFQKAMKIELTSKTSSVANISMICMNTELGKDFLKSYIEAYNEKGINDQIELADKTSKVIEEHLAQLSSELSNVESEAQTYKQSKGLTNIAVQADIYSTQSANIRQRQIDTETQLSIVHNIINQIESKTNHNQLIPAGSGVTNTSLNTQIDSYNTLVLEHNRLSRIASSSNQTMIDLNHRIESTFTSLKTGLNNEKNSLEIQLQDITSLLSQNYSRMKAIPQQEREYADIIRQQSVKEALFVYLLQKKEEKYMNMASATPNSIIIDNIYIKGIVSPNKKTAVILLLALSLILPILIITIRDLLRYKVYTKENIEKHTSIPILGILPKVENSQNILILENKKDVFNEMMRLVRTNLLFIANNKEKVINVISSISGEGKTFIAVNLAQSIALLDKKVLIIELDIRKPKLANFFSVDDKDKGVTLYLSEQIDKNKLITQSIINSNLYFIVSGPIPPNPNELLAKKELEILINELRSQFDYIIIDTSPISVVADSFLINRVVDINLYVARAGYTPKRCIEDIDKHNKENKLKKLYILLNSIDLNMGTYRYGYGKKHSYGYE